MRIVLTKIVSDRSTRVARRAAVGLLLLAACGVAFGQDATTDATDEIAAAAKKRNDELVERLSGTMWRGHFNVDGQLSELKEESYDVSSVKKLPGSDVWVFTTRIKYGNKDVKVPVPVKVSWADNTPVIIVDKVRIPGMGTFDARVVISGNRYAGSWQHDDVGGHLFGLIEKAEATEEGQEETASE